VKRRGVLLITNVVVLGLMGSNLFALSAGYMPVAAAIPILVFQGMLIALFTSTYLASKRQLSGTDLDA